ncbi:methyl-accepting chemotaxis protein [Sporosarcina sp. resist]|uniref:methyl-accepting chemotaxis protein n=1 Tax=Sporosarcina sp. resist TaxID=2762563 RepID=UPI00164DF299|nr:HAMP domain-containing methyl-accepting chemotaxis protein [Sporosarcina sp. resist]QNK87150.1 methyl-accepting chemotaxis protein [Sporosarcina sp. resist]
MKWTIGRKLGISFSIIMFIILTISVFSIKSSFTLNGNTTTINNEIIPEINMLNKINDQTDGIFIATQKNLISEDLPFKEKYEKEIEVLNKQLGQSLSEYQEIVVTNQGIEAFDKFKSNWTALIELTNEVIRLSNAGEMDQAIKKYYEVDLLFDATNENINVLMGLLKEQSEDIYNAGTAEFNRTFIMLVVVSIISLVLIIGIMFFFIRVIKKPVELLSEQAKQLADGNLTIEPVNIKNHDEVGQLGTDFNLMLLNLQGLVRNLQDHIQTVAATSEELAASAEETSKVTEQITSAMLDVSEGAEQQVQGARISNEAISEMVTGMDQATLSIHSVSDLAKSTKEYTSVGSSMMDQTMKQMTNIQRSSETTSKVIHSLGEKSTEISKIVGLITSIADQTNLLALNAAIEAARAGEYGKGFAVVADEVRKLAEDSSVAANQIREVIVTIQQEVVEAINAMTTSTSTVHEGIELVKKSEDNFQEISLMIENVASQTENITAVIEQLSANTISVKGQIDEVATLSESSSDKAQTVATAAEEQNATMEEVSASAQVLGKLSSELQEIVHEFKV